jgi:hypothetical protein
MVGIRCRTTWTEQMTALAQFRTIAPPRTTSSIRNSCSRRPTHPFWGWTRSAVSGSVHGTCQIWPTTCAFRSLSGCSTCRTRSKTGSQLIFTRMRRHCDTRKSTVSTSGGRRKCGHKKSETLNALAMKTTRGRSLRRRFGS